MLDEGVGRAEAHRGDDHLHCLEHAARGLEAARHLEGEDAARAGHLPAEEARRVGAGEAGVVDTLDLRVPGEPLRDHPRAILSRLHAQRQGGQAAVEEERRERVEQRPGGDAHLADPGRPRLARGDDPGDHVAVPAEELRRAVHHDRSPELERPLEDGGHERGVDQDRHARGVLHRLLDVHEVERGVAGGLEHDEAGVGAHRRRDAVRGGEGDLVAEQPAREQRVAAAVEGAHRHDVVLAALARGEEDGGERGHARREGHRGLRPLERREGRLVAGDGRVVEARVDEAAGGRAALAHGVDRGRGLGEGPGGVRGRQVERRRVDADLGEVLPPGVDGEGVEGQGAAARGLHVRMVPIRCIFGQSN